MTDDQNCRLFVGKLPEEADMQNVRERFKKYGVIQQVNVLVGYGFVHFTTEEAAAAAIEKENNTEFLGSTITVSVARPSKKKVQEVQQQKEEGVGDGLLPTPVGGPPRGRGRGGRGYPPAGWVPRGRGGYRGRGGEGPPYRGAYFPRGGARYQSSRPYHDRYEEEGGGGGSRYHERSGRHEGGREGERHYRSRSGGRSGGGPEAPPGMKAAGVPSKQCDCEIICIGAGRESRRYCERVEARLKNLGLEVDILFPNPDIPMEKIVSNIQGRGVKFALLCSPADLESGTATLRLLQGPQQGAEHPGLPLAEALHRIARAFESALEMESKVGKTGPGQRHPQDVLSVIGFLRENRPLSVMELDKLIRYLAFRREAMLKAEYGEGRVPAHLLTPPIGGQADPGTRAREEALRKKVLAILNPRPSSPPRQQQQQERAMEVDINPTLQRAIDSLISSGPNLLQGIRGVEGGGDAAS